MTVAVTTPLVDPGTISAGTWDARVTCRPALWRATGGDLLLRYIAVVWVTVVWVALSRAALMWVAWMWVTRVWVTSGVSW